MASQLQVAETPEERWPPDEWVLPPPIEPTRAEKSFGEKRNDGSE